MESQVHLYGHTEEVTSLFVCKPYSILISVSRDGTCVIWDLNRYGGSAAPAQLTELTFQLALHDRCMKMTFFCRHNLQHEVQTLPV